MDSKFGMKEEFDVSFSPSRKIDTDNLEMKGVCEVKHIRDNKLLSLDVGRNVITTAGKKHLVETLIGITPSPFKYIGLGRGGAIGATINDTALGGQSWNNNVNNGSDSGYYVNTSVPTSGYEYAEKFVLTGDVSDLATKVRPREANNADGSDSSELIHDSTDQRFYMDIDPSDQVSFTGDTILWSATFKFLGVVDAYTNDSVIINEAGIFNKDLHSTTLASSDEPVLLARRTFSDKPVKDADELTIKWKITIK